MASFLDTLIAGKFSQFSGLKISGTVPLQQDLVNEALGELVQGWAAPPAEPKKSNVPVAELLPLVRKLQVRAEPGVIHVDFDIGV